VVIADSDTQPNTWEAQELVANVPAGAIEARLVVLFDEADSTPGAVFIVAISLTALAGFVGDYNGDGFVDAADYTVWRDTLGQSVALGTGADGDLSGTIDAGDYDVWVNEFGKSSANVSAAAASVPEPATLLNALFLLCGASLARIRNSW
jgi:hypothetical protein